MLLIPCPWCGPRNETEFHYGGQADIVSPPVPSQCSDEEWGAYLFLRHNPKGPFTERWCHTAGCRQWFAVVRDTRTHLFLTASLPVGPDGVPADEVRATPRRP